MKITDKEAAVIRSRIEKLLNVKLPADIMVLEGEGLTVVHREHGYVIRCEDKPALARGYFLIAHGKRMGKAAGVQEKRSMRCVGPMIDVSRGAVLTVDACKQMIDTIAALGMNVFALYMEDTYTIPGYPYFGHLRGRYTQEELREIDDYCTEYGIELLPCIQTLAHLQQFLQWKASRSLSDTESCLLIDSEETYQMIEAAVKSMRQCVRTNRLHIGMDEAHDVGLGRYMKQHGAVNRFELLNRHLDRVAAICRKYDFEPMMWSDMYFRLGSPTGGYYDPDNHVPQSVIDGLPDVGMVYWDYYHKDEATYEHMFSEHERMGRPVIFAGGNWTWSGFLPQVSLTDATMYPALRVCLRHHVDTVLATMWGDDGHETDVFMANSQLPIFSEACWESERFTPERVHAIAETLTGIKTDVYEAFGKFNDGPEMRYTGKSIVYGDPLYRLLPGDPDLAAVAQRADEALKIIEGAMEHPECVYAAAFFRLIKRKAELIPAIRSAYERKDIEALKALVDAIPELIALTERAEEAHRDRWEKYHKHEGWELFAYRYGSLIGRLKDVRRTLARYTEGEIAAIEELDAEPLAADRWTCGCYYCGLTNPKSVMN